MSGESTSEAAGRAPGTEPLRPDAALCIFAKHPTVGEVKTRLARRIGAEAAARLYDGLLRYVVRVLAAPPRAYDTYLVFSPSTAEGWFRSLAEEHGCRGIFRQANGDLGHRMRSAIEETLGRGYRKVAIVGSDCPDVTPGLVEHAIAQLDRTDVVLGPSTDGGYYLIAMKEPHDAPFREMTWSTGTVLTETLQRLDAAGLAHALLPERSDIDHVEDLHLLPDELREFVV